MLTEKERKMEIKDFDNERDARIYRDSKRDEGHAASLYTYGKDKHKVKVMERATKEEQQKTQRRMSDQAWTLSKDIEDLTKIKALIASPDFGSDIEDSVLVAKKLEQEHWFPSSSSVINFFDGDFDLEKIKEMVDTALQEYEDDWNNLV